ncbi:unnamed protein product, partial [Phaeothamnion confervicola]
KSEKGIAAAAPEVIPRRHRQRSPIPSPGLRRRDATTRPRRESASEPAGDRRGSRDAADAANAASTPKAGSRRGSRRESVFFQRDLPFSQLARSTARSFSPKVSAGLST